GQSHLFPSFSMASDGSIEASKEIGRPGDIVSESPHTTSTLGFLSLQRNTEESTAGRPKEEVFSIYRAIVTPRKRMDFLS
ncbi:hypothetical protein Tco_1171969, partial [Tanacetum coccineum]